MLSFLRDGSQTPAAAQMQADETAGESTAAAQDFLRPAVRTQTVRQGTLLLAVLFLAGGAAVWWMIKKSGLSQAQGAAETETSHIDQVLVQLKNFQKDMNSQMDSVSSRFSQVSQLGQITVEELKKNPFRQEWTAPTDGQDLSLSQSLLLKEEMRRKAAGLKLWSITARADRSCCMIGDKVLYVGDEINGFVVKEIHPDRVVLGWEDLTVELKIEE